MLEFIYNSGCYFNGTEEQERRTQCCGKRFVFHRRQNAEQIRAVSTRPPARLKIGCRSRHRPGISAPGALPPSHGPPCGSMRKELERCVRQASVSACGNINSVGETSGYGADSIARSSRKTEAYVVSRRERKRSRCLFAHPKRMLRLNRLRLEGPNGRETSSSWRPPPRI